MSRKRCECGRRALALPKFGKRRSRKARAGVPVAIKGCHFCVACFERFEDSNRRVK